MTAAHESSHWAEVRAHTRAYAETHNLQTALEMAVKQAMHERAPDALTRVAHLLLEQASSGAIGKPTPFMSKPPTPSTSKPPTPSTTGSKPSSRRGWRRAAPAPAATGAPTVDEPAFAPAFEDTPAFAPADAPANAPAAAPPADEPVIAAPAEAPAEAPAAAPSPTAWRQRMLFDAAMGMEFEIRTEVANSTLEAERATAFQEMMQEGPLSHDAEWYADDANFEQAMARALAIKREVTHTPTVLELISELPAQRRHGAAAYVVRWLDAPSSHLRRSATELLGGNTLYGAVVARGRPPMPSAVLAPFTDTIVRRLDDENSWIRHAAGEMLALLPTTRLETHAAEIVAHLRAPEPSMRDSTLHALGKLPPPVIAPHAAAIAARLEDDEWLVRKSALWVLGRLPYDALASQLDVLRTVLAGNHAKVKYFNLALHALLCRAAPDEQQQHLGLILTNLTDTVDWNNRWAAVEALGKISPELLAEREYAERLAYALEDNQVDVREAAVEMLRQPAVIAPTAPLVAQRLAHPDVRVRRAAVDVLLRLGAENLEAHADDVAPLLGDEHVDLRASALRLLGRMVSAAPLAPHGAALVARLDDEAAPVREATVELLTRHPDHAPALIAPHADAIAALSRDGGTKTRYAALETIAKHPPVLAQRLDDVVARLDDLDHPIRLLAAMTLGAFSADELRPHAKALRKRLYDYDINVRRQAQSLLSRL